jgi:hypothetical protein
LIPAIGFKPLLDLWLLYEDIMLLSRDSFILIPKNGVLRLKIDLILDNYALIPMSSLSPLSDQGTC